LNNLGKEWRDISSPLQVVSSSRIGNAIYFTAGSVLGTLILQAIGIPLTLTVETALVVIPFSSLLGVILWSLQIERYFLELVFWVYVRHRQTETRKLMARVTNFIRPWESSMKKSDSIYNILQRETGRTLNSIQVRSDVDQVSQLFWAVVISLPVVFMFGSIFPPLSSILVIIALWSVFSAIVSLPILFRKRRSPSAIVFLSFCRWLTELIVGDERRRKTIAVFRQWVGDNEQEYEANVELRETIDVWTKELIQLAIQEDWKGFYDNSENFSNYLSTALPGITKYSLDHYWLNWCWYIGKKDSPNPLLRIALINNTWQLADTIRELTGWKTLPVTFDEVNYMARNLNEQFTLQNLVPMVKTIYDAEEKSRWFYPTHSIEELLGLFSKSMIRALDDTVLYKIFTAAYLSAKQERLPEGCKGQIYSKDIEKRVFQVADCIFRCIEVDVLNGRVAIPAITSWYPTFRVEHDYGIVTSQIIMEQDVGLSPNLATKLLRQVLNNNIAVDKQKIVATLQRHFQTPEVRSRLRSILLNKAQGDYVRERKDSLAIQASLGLGFIDDIEQLLGE